MTENEAKLILDVRISRFDHADDVNEALEVAKTALEEIQKYRKLGTVEEFKNYKDILSKTEADKLAKIIDEWLLNHKISKWIPCSDRLPEEKINPVTNDFYEYQVTFKSENVTDIRHYKFGRGHWWHGPGIMDKYVTAWKEQPEAYKEGAEE